jgi:hypothetical protein
MGYKGRIFTDLDSEIERGDKEEATDAYVINTSTR